jgi:hypothetical protein
MRPFTYSLVAVLFFGLAAGCAQIQEIFPVQRYEPADAVAPLTPAEGEMHAPKPPIDQALVTQHGPAHSPAVDMLLSFLARFQTLPPLQQTEEYRRIAQLYETTPEDVVRLQFAATLLTPGKNFSNALRGRELLQEYLKNENQADEDLTALAKLLVAMVDEREYLELQLAREKETSETLARQLNELRNIENIMRQREVNDRPRL